MFLIVCGLKPKYMANSLNFREQDLQNTNALAIFGRELFDILYPEAVSPVDPIVEKTVSKTMVSFENSSFKPGFVLKILSFLQEETRMIPKNNINPILLMIPFEIDMMIIKKS